MDPISWAAGLFEGEGCFFLNRVKGRGGRPYQYPCAILKMTDEDVVRRFAEVVGVGHVWFRKVRVPSGRPRKDCWIWRCHGFEDTSRVFGMFKELLGKRRLETGTRLLHENSPTPRTKIVREHGTRSRYRAGCRCRRCKNVQKERIAAWRVKPT